MGTGEWALTTTHGHPSISTGEEPAGGPVTDRECAREPLRAGLAAEETSFYAQYPWCLNAFPTIREVVHRLSEELDKLERQIRQLEIEREAIKRENDEAKLRELNTEIANLSVERPKACPQPHLL